MLGWGWSATQVPALLSRCKSALHVPPPPDAVPTLPALRCPPYAARPTLPAPAQPQYACMAFLPNQGFRLPFLAAPCRALQERGLSGTITPGGWPQLQSLREVSLRGNKLSGSISQDWVLPPSLTGAQRYASCLMHFVPLSLLWQGALPGV